MSKFLKMSSVLLILMLGSIFFINPSRAESSFFANQNIQEKFPKSFILQKPSESFVRSLEADSLEERSLIIEKIKAKPLLFEAVKNWQELSVEEQIPYLKQIFKIEVETLKIVSPELLFDADLIPGRAAFFDFDVVDPSPGRVILNPKVLKKMNKFASLALLIHETRHSAQFQRAFLNNDNSYVASLYKSAFEVQKKGEAKSFCDFLTLTNEHEAFYFGNYVVGNLTNWTVNMPKMGTYAAQFDVNGVLKIDLVKILDDGQPGSLLEKFNELEKEQCKLIGACE